MFTRIHDHWRALDAHHGQWAHLQSAPMLAHANVWHYYLSIFLIVPILLVLIGIFVGYLVKVVAPKYGRR
jgi:heme/copper-type cytochrome/quinol oxidase subunit 2